MNNLIQLKEEIINQKLEEFTEECAALSKWSDFQASPLAPTISAAVIRESFKTVFKSVLDEKRDGERTAKGVAIIDHNLGRLPNAELCRQELRSCAERLAHNLIQAMQKFNNHPENIKEFKWVETDPEKKNGPLSSVADLLGFSFETTKSFYEIGALLYEEKKYEEACCVFQFLSLVQPNTFEIWFSLGLCHQQLKDWFSAVYCYSLASVMNPQQIDPYIFGAECFLAGNDRQNARGSLEVARKFLTDDNREIYMPIIEKLMKRI